MERSKASSISITSSTVSRESAPRSFTNDEVFEILSLATPSCLETISMTLVSISAVDAIAPPSMGSVREAPVMGANYMDTLSAIQGLTLEPVFPRRLYSVKVRLLLFLLIGALGASPQEPPRITLEKSGTFKSLVSEVGAFFGVKLSVRDAVEDKPVDLRVREAGLLQALDALCRAHGAVTYLGT